jgi:hypothetical protein
MNVARSIRLPLVLGTSLAGLGLAVSACAPASPPAASAPAAQPAANGPNAVPVKVDGRPFAVWNCERQPQVEPASFVLGCGDGGFGLRGVHWAKWAPADAAGAGTEYLNDCTPDCASGHFLDYPVDIRLAGRALVAQNEPFGYTRITLSYTGARPPAEANGQVTHPATWSERLWTGRPAAAAYPSGAPEQN